MNDLRSFTNRHLLCSSDVIAGRLIVIERSDLASLLRVAIVFAAVLCGPLHTSISIAQDETNSEPAKPLRELFVPFEELDVLIANDTKRVYMTRDEYEDLLKLARVQPALELPIKQALLSANYKAAIENGRGFVQADLRFELLSAGWHVFTLPISGLGIRAAQLDEVPAALAKNEQGQTLLFMSGVGIHRLTLDMVMPVTLEAAQQTLQFQLPTAPVGNLSLTVPGNVEIKAGAEVIRRDVNQEGTLTSFEIVPSPQPMSILVSLNNKTLRENSTVIARGVLVSEVTQGYERFHATMSMSVLNGATDEFRFAIGNDLEVNLVQGDSLSRWSVESLDGQKQLVIKLHSPTTERVVLNARFDRPMPRLQPWQFPELEPIEVAGYAAVLGILVDERLTATAIQPESLIAIDTDVLISALPQRLAALAPNTPPLTAIAAYYAAGPKYKLLSEFSAQAASLMVSANSLVTVSEQGIEVSGGFSLNPLHEKLFFVDFVCPGDWTIDEVRTSDQRKLQFDRFPATDAEAGQADAKASRIRVAMPEGVPPGGHLDILFHGTSTPSDWLGSWQTLSLRLPKFPLLNTDNQFGAVAVIVEDDLLVAPESLSGLLVMSGDEKSSFHLADVDAALAYRYKNVDWQAMLKVSRSVSRMTAHVLSFLQLHPEALNSHTELIFHVTQSHTQSVSFSLPESTPGEVAIRGLNGIEVNESSSNVVDGKRIWTVQLAERQSDEVRLAIDFTKRLGTKDKTNFQFPVVRAENVDYQSGTIAVEGHAELDIELSQHPRPVDIGELVDAQYQVGKRLVGVFGYVGLDDLVTANVAHVPVKRLPSTIVERAELLTLISAHGRSQTAARFHLRTKADYLEARLPDDAQLWSVLLDGKPALPQREGNRVLVPLSPNRQTTMRDLQLIYECSSNHLRLRSHVSVFAPELFERDERNVEGISIPVADLKWECVLPHGYRVAAIGDNSLSSSADDVFSLHWLRRRLWDLGGGKTEWYSGLFANRLSSVESSSEAPNAMARTSSEIDGSPADLAISDSSGPDLAMQPPQSANDDLFGSQTTEGQVPMENQESRLDSLSLPDEPDSVPAPIPAAPPAGNVPEPAFDSPMVPTEPVPTKSESGSIDSFEIDQTKDSKLAKVWALEGVRSLAIHIDTEVLGDRVQLTSLGIQPSVTATIVHQARLNWLAAGTGLLVFLVGILLFPPHRRLRYLYIVALIACLTPPITGWSVELAPFTSGILASILALVGYSLVQSIWLRPLKRKPSLVDGVKAKNLNMPGTSTTVLLVLAFPAVLFFPGNSIAQVPATAAEEVPGQVVSSPQQLAQLLMLLGGTDKVTLPSDAVVIPYDPSQSSDSMFAEKLLVPYPTYIALWNRTYPEKKSDDVEPSTSHAWSGAEYEMELSTDDSLRMTGKLFLEQFVDREIAIPLRLSGCVLENVLLDGKPPRLQMVESQTQPPAPPQDVNAPNADANANAISETSPNSMLVLHSAAKGRKLLEFTLRWKLEKNSGWRVMDGIVPSSPACQLTVRVPKAATEVRFSGTNDRSSHESTGDNETIVTSLSSDGRLSMQWRDKIAEATVDQGLTVVARSVFDIQEDSLKYAWHGTFEFRNGRREAFSLQLPGDYLVQKVIGNNIRGWETKTDGTTQTLNVELLKAVAERETLTVFISKPREMDPVKSLELSVPQIKVPDAMLQQGHVAVRRSILLDLRTADTDGVTRIDAPDESEWLAGHEDPGPLALRVYQAYRYSQVPFVLHFTVETVPSRSSVQFQTLLKVTQRELSLESRLLIAPLNRAVFRLEISLPVEWKIERPELAGSFQWSMIADGERQRLFIYLANGQSEPFAIVLRGRIDREIENNSQLPLPSFTVLNCQKQEGAIVVQSDPAYEVRAENLQGCESALLDSVNAWLAPIQRESARVAIRFTDTNFSGSLRITERTPLVSSMSVSNVKVTDRAIEETIFIDANIRSAGIREFVFLVPAHLANAKIRAPLLQRKNIIEVPDRKDVVRIQLILQNETMGQFRVIVEHDHELAKQQQSVPIPVIETGTTKRRIITLENASRDEVVTREIIAIERIERSELIKQIQTDLLVGKASVAYLVKEGPGDPTLTYETQTHEALVTVDARIGLAQALVVIDEHGTYRATQEFRIENRTEPYLEIELPQGAELWTAKVVNEPVKPSAVDITGSEQGRRVRLPLVKTAEGDLDYVVVVKYGGQVAEPSWFRRMEIPLIRTVNINVELSQVRLRLPQAYRWFSFDGTLGRVDSETDFQAGWLSFRTRQLSDLTRLLGSSGASNDFSKARATNNLKQLKDALQNDNVFFQQQLSEKTGELQKQLLSNSAAIDRAQQQIVATEQQQAGVERGNRSILYDLFDNQFNGRSLNALDALGQNFDVDTSARSEEAKPNSEDAVDTEHFQRGWLENNQLGQSKPNELKNEQFLESIQAKASPQRAEALNAPVLETARKKMSSGESNGESRAGADDTASASTRYRLRLEQQNGFQNGNALQQQTRVGVPPNGTNAPMNADPAMMGDFAVPRQSEELLGPAREGQAVTGFDTSSGGLDGGMGGGGISNDTFRGGQTMPGITGAANVNGVFGERPPSTDLPATGFLTSLDVDLPQRGQEFLFSTPRGNAQLSVKGISHQLYERLIAVVALLIGGLIVWQLYRLVDRTRSSRWGIRLLVTGLLLFGSISLLNGYLPIYGILAILAAVSVIVSSFRDNDALKLEGSTQ